jgi:hypothetical protein
VAIEWAQDASLEVQPQGEEALLPYFLKTDIGKIAALFGNQLNQNYNMIMADIPLAMKNKNETFLKRSAFAVKTLEGLMLTGFVMGIINRKRLPEDKKEIIQDVLSTFLSPLPIIGDEIVSWIEGNGAFGSQSAYTGLARDIGMVGKKMVEGDSFEDIAKAVLSAIPEVVRIMGGPAVLLQRVIRSITEANLWPMIGGGPK